MPRLKTPTAHIPTQSPAAFERFGPSYVDIKGHDPMSPILPALHQAYQGQNDATELFLGMRDRIKNADLSRLVESAQLESRQKLGRDFLARLRKLAESDRVAAVRSAVVRRQDQILAATNDPGEPTARQLEIAKLLADMSSSAQMMATDTAVAAGDAETVISIVRAPSFIGFEPETKARLRIEFGSRRLPDIANQLEELSDAELKLWGTIKTVEAAIHADCQLPTHEDELRPTLAGGGESMVQKILRQNSEASLKKYDPSIRPEELDTFATAAK